MKRISKNLLLFLLSLCLLLALSSAAFAVCTEHDFDNGVITLEPTCDTIGIITYTCRNCGAQTTAKVGNLGHHYVDGVCSICGLAEGESAEAAPAVEIAPVSEPAAKPAVAPENLEVFSQHSPSGSFALRGGLVIGFCGFGLLIVLLLLFSSKINKPKRK